MGAGAVHPDRSSPSSPRMNAEGRPTSGNAKELVRQDTARPPAHPPRVRCASGAHDDALRGRGTP
ncbi:Hypothetical protein CAP_4240 [Chondromyces apiculatus DSM 436]|uniref:Uncharacterized protein n=1 Tax=Chondromyces apiculatus DSM 436 TaxID=1192034 RepID=A0A017T6A8_9BACT|nr:Hypothetical protein CAP_4240 [Chondromyces apiculatus DSM 436]